MNWTQAEINALMAERDAAEKGADAAIQMRNESLARAHAAEALADVSAAAQGVVDAWHEPERPYIGERMDILGTVLGNLKQAREATNERDYCAKELDKATGMVEMYADDAEAARLLWRQSEAACAKMHADRDAAIKERDEALSLAKERGGELALCWCVATDSSPDDAPDPFPAGMAYKAVDAMQDREYAAETRALKAEADRDAAIRERDEALAILRDLAAGGAAAFNDAIDRARKLVGGVSEQR